MDTVGVGQVPSSNQVEGNSGVQLPTRTPFTFSEHGCLGIVHFDGPLQIADPSGYWAGVGQRRVSVAQALSPQP